MLETVILRQEPTLDGAVRKRRCPVCGSLDTRRKVVTDRGSGRTAKVRRCRSCGHVKVLNNRDDFASSVSVEGRELGMAQLATAVLRRPRLDVLLYRTGRSGDQQDIASLPRVRRVAVGGSGAGGETFDVVIASEVIEHFARPRKDFKQLFGYVHRAGIVVCSTNVYDGGDLNRQAHVFSRGHVSYYTPTALRRIAKANRMHVDFRLPAASKGVAGARKRFVIFSHSQDVMESVSDYFGATAYAPSEKPVKRSREVQGRTARVVGQAGRHPSALG